MMPPLPDPILRKPAWLRSRIGGGAEYRSVRDLMRQGGLHTVCESADCPNQGECWGSRTATFLLLGNLCTRACRFCEVPKGKPDGYDLEEPGRVAAAAGKLGLRYVVLTSVTRDDLEDQGARIWAETIRAVKQALPGALVEALVPDFQARLDLLDQVLDAKPDVLNHNFETVERLQKPVRGVADMETSGAVLRQAKARGFVTKTGFMLGMGEEADEVRAAIRLCASLGVDILTLGQYLQPARDRLPVVRYVPPEEFAEHRLYALEAGIPACEAGPLVRSSYRAEASARPLLEKT